MQRSENSRLLPWENNIFKHLLNLAWPIAIAMLSTSMMAVTDTYFVGAYGKSALAGTGLGGIVSFLFVAGGIGLTRSVKVRVSQARGSGGTKILNNIITNGLFLGLVAGVVFALVGSVCSGFLPRLATTEGAGPLAQRYTEIRLLFAPLFLMASAAREALLGDEDSRSPMFISIGVNLLNALLDYVLLRHFHLGVAGAAWATGLSQAAEFLALFAVHRFRGFRFAKLSAALLGDLFRVGRPLAVQFTLELGSFTTMTFIIGSYGDSQLAAHHICLQMIHLSFLPALAIGEAASIMVGESVGAARFGLVTLISRRAATLAAAYCGLCGLVFWFAGPGLARTFSSDLSVLALAARLLRIAAIFQAADGLNIVARCVLRGSGDVKVPARMSMAISWGLLPPLTWLLGSYFKLGAVGGWWALTADIFIATGLLWFRLHAGYWKKAAEESRQELKATEAAVIADSERVSLAPAE